MKLDARAPGLEMNQLDERTEEKENRNHVRRGLGTQEDMQRKYGQQTGGPEGAAVTMSILPHQHRDGDDRERAKQHRPDSHPQFIRPQQMD